MAAQALPEPPAQLKAIQSYMRIAQDIERVDPVVSYWLRLFSTESALKIDRDSPDCKKFLNSLIIWLETFKQQHKDNEAVTNQTVGQAHAENFVDALFTKADTFDRDGKADKGTVRMFYMAAILFEAMAVFGPLTEDVSKKAKYAKFKAAYIQKCLRTGQTPKPGPIENEDLEGDGSSSSVQKPDGPQIQDISNTSNSDSNNRLTSPSQPTATRPTDPFIMTPSHPPLPPSTPAKSPNSDPSAVIPPKYPSSQSATSSSAGVSIDQTKSGLNAPTFKATNGALLKPEDIIQGQKYCKFANSALQYDDVPTAVANLEKALKLLTTGRRDD